MPVVLVVDDEPDYRFLLRMLLSEHQHVQVLEAHNGKHALEIIDSTLPDLVVADLRMPVMGAAELVERLRADERTADIRIIVWSADPDRSLDVDAIVPKPYAGDALLRHVTELLERP